MAKRSFRTHTLRQSLQSGVQTSCSLQLDRSEKHPPTPKFFPGGGGGGGAGVSGGSQFLFGRQRSPPGDTRNGLCLRRTQNQPDRSPAQDPRGSAGDNVNRVRLGPPGSPARRPSARSREVRLLFGEVSRPKSPQPGYADGWWWWWWWFPLAPPTPAGGGGPGLAVRRAPRPGCARATPQVSARAALEVSSRAFSGAPRFPARAARGPPGDGTSAARSEALDLPTRRPLGHLPTCWSFAK